MTALRKLGWLHGLVLLGAVTLLLESCGSTTDPNYPEQKKPPVDTSQTTSLRGVRS